MIVKTLDLHSFLKELNYNWEDDKELVERLCALTKCRADENLKRGYESCYLFKALANRVKPSRFFEIGFGRGTTSYLMALGGCDVETHDIDSFTGQRRTWCDYKEVEMSNFNFLKACAEEFEDVRTQIIYRHCDTGMMRPEDNPDIDMAYIDGSHHYMPVLHDFNITMPRMKDDSIIIMDDYHDDFGVKPAIDEILKRHDAILVEVNGHIYGDNPEKGSGHIIIPFGSFKDLL